MANTTTQQKPASTTLELHRHFRAPPERVYKAFLDPEAMAKWSPPYGFTGQVTQMEAKVGGTYKMHFTNFGTGTRHSFGGKYEELTPHKRIRYTDAFDDPKMGGSMRMTIDLKPSSVGTFVTIKQEGLPANMPIEYPTMGWQESLEQFAKLVEPEIPDAPVE